MEQGKKRTVPAVKLAAQATYLQAQLLKGTDRG